MVPQSLMGLPGRVDVILALLGVATIVSALASLGQTWIEQRFSTRRFDTALMNAEPKLRAEIIRAWVQLERVVASKSENDRSGKARARPACPL
jgi:hypothetical protein